MERCIDCIQPFYTKFYHELLQNWNENKQLPNIYEKGWF